MAKPNIIIFTGIDTYSLEESLRVWVRIFGEKYGEHNISYIDASDTGVDWRGIEGEVVSGGFLAEKRLFIIRNLVIKIRKKDTKEVSDGDIENDENDEEEDEENIHRREVSLMNILQTIPDDNFIVFVNPIIPKTKKLYKELDSVSTKKEYTDQYNRKNWERRFPHLDAMLIREVIDIYSSRENPKNPKPISFDIYTTLEHIDLYGELDKKYQVRDFISLEKEFIIFSFLDELFAGRKEKARGILHSILLHTNIYAFVGFLISNLRNTLYIKALSHSMKATEIERTLKIHPFVVEKSLNTRINEGNIREFFHHLIKSNIAQKSGKGMKESELGLIFSIELGILELQKS